MIPVTYPGIVYIRFFCDETDEDRLQKLPCAHYAIMVFNILACVGSFATGNNASGVNQLISLGINYYFLTVVKRYVNAKSTM